jgi:hypothetical protein
MTLEHMRELMDTIGFSQLEERWKPGGKMIYLLYEKQSPPEKRGTLHVLLESRAISTWRR